LQRQTGGFGHKSGQKSQVQCAGANPKVTEMCPVSKTKRHSQQVRCFFYCVLLFSLAYFAILFLEKDTPSLQNQFQEVVNVVGAEKQEGLVVTSSLVKSLSSSQTTQRNLIQIGANDGVKGNNDEVQKFLRHPHTKAILVEGSPSVFKLLTKNIKKLYDPSLQRIIPVNALVCKEGQKMLFYSVDTQKLKQASTSSTINLPHWVEYQLASLEKTSILTGLKYYLLQKSKQFQKNVNAEEFIVKEYMNCVSFQQILAISSMAAKEIQVLAIDVEGYDANIMIESFKVPGLEPNLIIFEWKSTINLFPKEFNLVMETLHERGYTTNCKQVESDTKSNSLRVNDAGSDWSCGGKLGGGQDVYARKT